MNYISMLTEPLEKLNNEQKLEYLKHFNDNLNYLLGQGAWYFLSPPEGASLPGWFDQKFKPVYL